MSKLEQLRDNDFLILGRAGMDFCPDPPGTKTKDGTVFTAALGGSSANIGVAICKLGGKASLVTCVSDDAVGYFCLQQLDNYGINRDFVRVVGGEYRTSLAVYESRIEDHQTVIYRNLAADFQMDLEDVAKPDYSLYSGLITTGTIFAAEPSRSAGIDGLMRAQNAGIPIIFDIDYRPYSWTSVELASDVLTKAAMASDIIIGNDVEFDFMAGGTGKGLALARELGQSSDKIIVYKMGELGSITITGGKEFSRGIFHVEALKPTGAGDSFMGAFIATLAAGKPLEEAVERGSANAAIVVSNVGCSSAMPDNERLDYFIEKHPGMTQPKV